MRYQKGYSSQHSLIPMFEKWQKNRECLAFLQVYLKYLIACGHETTIRTGITCKKIFL